MKTYIAVTDLLTFPFGIKSMRQRVNNNPIKGNSTLIRIPESQQKANSALKIAK